MASSEERVEDINSRRDERNRSTGSGDSGCHKDIPADTGCWTEWFDRDDPTDTGDWETLENLYIENPGKICNEPVWIEAETTSGRTPESAGNVIAKYNPMSGFVCLNKDQKGCKCHDYKVRFMCPLEFCRQKVCWTQWFDRDTPNGLGDWEIFNNLRNENPGEICESPLYIDVHSTNTNTPADYTGQNFYKFSLTEGFVCRNRDQKGRRCLNYKIRFGCPCNVK
ncbi:unnamed protein product [Knipowitschia caucasica]|uniref:WxxW domain-containing protein n=1 Tax=Knipowitschia caucasica TaxID=637954 RepID=A0AAV2MTL1_KNICA